MTFKRIITIALLILFGFAGFLIASLEYREIFQEPDFFALQETQAYVENKIIKVGPKTETIFATKDQIQDFAITKNQMLVSIGEKNKESELILIDLKTKAGQKLDFAGKVVEKIASSDNNFAIIFSQNATKKLGIIQDNIVKEFNPQSLLTNDCCLMLNPSGSFLVFKGLAEREYLVDLENLENATNLKTEEKQQSKYFLNDKDLVYVSGEFGQIIKLVDVISGEAKEWTLKSKYPTEVAISKDLSKVFSLRFETTNGTNSLVFETDTKIFSDPNFNYTDLAIHPNSKFVILEKINKKDSKIESLDVYNTRTGQISKKQIPITKVVWAK